MSVASESRKQAARRLYKLNKDLITLNHHYLKQDQLPIHRVPRACSLILSQLKHRNFQFRGWLLHFRDISQSGIQWIYNKPMKGYNIFLYSFDILFMEVLLSIIETFNKTISERSCYSLIAMKLCEIKTSARKWKFYMIDNRFLKTKDIRW